MKSKWFIPMAIAGAIGLWYLLKKPAQAAINWDVNGDGSVDMGDVIKLERMILGLDTPDLRFDFDKDGVLTANDVTLLENHILGV